MEQELGQASNEENIRTRAYYLWEQATEPKGSPDDYWEQARAEIGRETPVAEIAAETAAGAAPSTKV